MIAVTMEELAAGRRRAALGGGRRVDRAPVGGEHDAVIVLARSRG